MSTSESKPKEHALNTILSELQPALIILSKKKLDSLRCPTNTSLVVTEAICIY